MAKTRRRGHIRKRGNRWVVVFRVNGKQVWRSFPTKTAAELYLANTQAQITRGAFKAPEKVSFGTAAEHWYSHGKHVGGGVVRGSPRPLATTAPASTVGCCRSSSIGRCTRSPLGRSGSGASSRWPRAGYRGGRR